MLRAFRVFVTIKSCRVIRDVVIEFTGNASRHFTGRNLSIGCGINFYPVAGIQHQRFSAPVFTQQSFCFETATETFASLDIGGVMAEAYAKNLHLVSVA